VNPIAATDSNCRIETFQASDGYELRYRLYPAQGPSRGTVVYVHGIQSHGGWYVASCRHLAGVGWQVAFLDRRGSGLNERERGDCPSFRRLIADLDEFIRARCPQPPPLIAVSWGGKLAVALEQMHPGRTAGLALLTPGLCPRIRPPLRQRLRIALSRLIRPTRRFAIPLDDPELFTAVPYWQQFIRDDPLALRQATARFLVESVRLDWFLRRCRAKLTIPVLLALAGQDRIIDNRRTRDFLERLAPESLLVKEYPQAQHTLEFEPDTEDFFRDLSNWLEVSRKN